MKQTTLIIFLLCSVLAVFWTACSTTELNPAYVYIEAAEVLSTSNQGANTDKITTVWAFVGNEPLGVFELPALIPILEEGMNELTIQAGINNNGVSADRVIYPFYQAATFNLDLQPLETDTLTPVFSYSNSARFAYISDFDAFGNFFEGDITVTSNGNEVLSGSGSGKVELTSTNSSFVIRNSNSHALPITSQQPVYLEIDYKCTHSFDVFLEAADNLGGNPVGSFLLFITPKDDWNKIYIDLTTTIAALQQQDKDQYRIIFDGNLPDEDASGTFLWDNIKLIYQD